MEQGREILVLRVHRGAHVRVERPSRCVVPIHVPVHATLHPRKVVPQRAVSQMGRALVNPMQAVRHVMDIIPVEIIVLVLALGAAVGARVLGAEQKASVVILGIIKVGMRVIHVRVCRLPIMVLIPQQITVDAPPHHKRLVAVSVVAVRTRNIKRAPVRVQVHAVKARPVIVLVGRVEPVVHLHVQVWVIAGRGHMAVGRMGRAVTLRGQTVGREK